ncbi:MAG: F0F1 ATP synthase subunit A [Chitinophagaceae bacterium]|nr:F0F1 ATP synthase subunit A [Chitinophagaceae bacterium]
MSFRFLKSFTVAAFSVFSLLFSGAAWAQDHGQEGGHGTEKTSADHKEEKKGAFNAQEVIFDHVLNAHEFHFMDLMGKDGEKHPITIPLPVILYSQQRGLDVFMSSNFHHGHSAYKGYRLEHGKVIAVKEDGVTPDESVSVLDISLTRNVVQMILALAVLVWIMTSIARRYKNGQGVSSAPKGWQNAIEPVITFVRDEVAKPNLGDKAGKYLPYLLTVFFFILINNIFGLIPGSANVTGNIAFTAVLGVISLVIILFSSNKHYWGHIFNPPVPGAMKPIIALVEFIGAVFTKPAALIIRLFANMLAGHIIIICLISLIFIFANMSKGIGVGFTPVSIAFTVFIYLIEILVAFIQAFIFTNLTAVFIGQAMEGAHHDEAHAAH